MNRNVSKVDDHRRDSNDNHELWSVEDVSAFLRVPIGTLYQWRYRRTGPRAFKVGRHLRYHPADVRAWLDRQAA